MGAIGETRLQVLNECHSSVQHQIGAGARYCPHLRLRTICLVVKNEHKKEANPAR